MESKRNIIYDILKKEDGQLNLREISRKYNINPITLSKWVRIFELEGKVKTRKWGNMKIVKVV